MAVLCLLLCGMPCRAQYHPVFDQYMFNGMALNPACAGNQDVLSLSAMYRTSRWQGYEGAPVTQLLATDFPLKNPKIALGLLTYNDKIAIFRQTGAYVSYAFRVKLDNGKLSFGLQAGFEQMREDGNRLQLVQQNDPMFDLEIHKSFMPNAGVGLYYYAPQVFLGLSVPRLLTYSSNTADSYRGKPKPDNVMLYGGFTFAPAGNFKIRPSVLLQYIHKGFLYDLNCNFILFPHDRIEIGASYRHAGTLVAMALVRVNAQISLGYAYDHAFSKPNAANGAHEIMLRYDFRFRVKAEDPAFLR